MKLKSKTPKVKSKKKSDDVDFLPSEKQMPATREVLRLVRDGLRSDILSSEYRLESKIDQSRAETKVEIQEVGSSVNGRIDQVEKFVNGRIDQVEKSVNGRIDQVEKSVNGRIDALSERVGQLDKKMDARLGKVEIAILTLSADLKAEQGKRETMYSEVSRTLAIVEEQRSETRIFYDVLKGMMDRQDRTDRRVDGIEELVRAIAKPAGKA